MRASTADVGQMAPRDVETLVQELQAHQVELEIQNEELREAQAKLAASRDRLADLYDHAPVGYVTLDGRGEVLQCNHTAADMLGMERGGLLGRNLDEFVTPEARDVLYLHRQEVMTEGGKRVAELPMRLPDGKVRNFRFESRRRDGEGDGGAPCCRSAMSDVTERKQQEARLVHQRDLMRRIFDNIPVMLVMWDPRLERFTLNRHAEEVLGWSAADANGPEFMEKVYPDPAERAVVADFMQRLDSEWEEFAPVRKDGDRVPSEWTNIRLRDDTMIGIGVDVRERKKSEEQLRALNEALEERVRERTAEWRKMSQVFRDATDPIIIEDLEGVMLEVNDEVERLFGWRREELAGRSVRMIVPEERHGQVDELLEACRGGESVRNVEGVRLTKSGEEIPVLLTLSLLRSEGEEPDTIASIAKDMRTLKEAEKQLRESEERLRQLTEQLRDVVWLREAETFDVLYCNEAFERIFGRPSEILDTDLDAFFEAIHPADRKRMRAALERLVEGEGFDEEFRIVRPDGSIRWLRDRGFPIRDEEGRIYRFAGTAEDITDRRAARRRMKRLEREVSEAAEEERHRIAQDLHDSIGAMLSTVNLRLRVIEEDLAEGRAPEADAIKMIARLTEETIAQARTTTRGLHPVGDNPEDLMAALRDLASSVEVHASLRCRFRCPQPVRVDNQYVANQLFRIAQEAVNNAVKHSDGSRLGVGLKAKDGNIMLFVKDDGRGVGEGKDCECAAGLGLRIMRYRAGSIGARLEIAPRRRKGTMVVCTLEAECPEGDGED